MLRETNTAGLMVADPLDHFASRVNDYFNPDVDCSETDRALNDIVELLGNAATSQAAGERLVAEHNVNERQNTEANLYRYLYLIRAVTRQHPEVRISSAFLGFAGVMAHQLGETDVEVEIMEQAPVRPGDASELRPISFLELLSEITKEGTDNIGQIVSDSKEGLKNTLQDANVQFGHSHEHAEVEERTLIARLKKNPDKLLEAIETGQFVTVIGRETAHLAHDDKRLMLYESHPELLRRALTGETPKFKSPQGIAAASAIYDKHMLTRFGSLPPDELLTVIDAGVFLTPEGTQTAEHCQDLGRLGLHENDPELLLEDLMGGKFRTEAGIIAAEYLQDNLRLMRTHNSKGLL